MPLRLNWDALAAAATAQRVYRDTAPMDPMDLPEPLAELGPTDETYLDDDGLVGLQTYYYRVSAVDGPNEAISAEVSITYIEGSIVDPTQLAGCILWLDSEELGSLSDGAPVTTWEDKSGLGHDFTQPTSGQRPTFKASTPEFLGRPTVSFASASPTQSLIGNHAVLQAAANTGQTILYVALLGETPFTGSVYAWRSQSLIGFQALQQPGARASYYGHGGVSILPTENRASVPQVITTLHPATDSGLPSTLRAEMHDVLSATPTNPALVLPANTVNVRVGAREDDSGNPAFALNGLVGEIVVYNRVLSDNELRAVERYLMGKWFPAKSPADLGGTFLHYRADDLALGGGDPVTSWPDATGNGHTATPTGTPPTFREDGIGGKPFVEFGGANGLSIGGSAFTDNTSANHTLLLVMQSDNHAHRSTAGVFYNGRAAFGFRGDGRSISLSVSPAGKTATFLTADLDPDRVYGYVGSKAGTAVPSLYWTGQRRVADGPVAQWAEGTALLGSSFTGKIYEVALFDRVLTPTEVQCLTEYLRDRYGSEL